MVNDKDFDAPDFAVLPPVSSSSLKVFGLFKDLKNKCKASLLKGRMHEGEDKDDFLLRVALQSSSVGGALFRKADTANDALAIVWMSLVRDRAQRFCFENELVSFGSLDIDQLSYITSLSKDPSNISSLPMLLAAEFGIILIVEKYFAGMKMDGCAFRLPNGTPVVGISTRYNRYDNFWFTLSHELSHIALHYELLDSPIVDDFDQKASSDIEVEANRLATDSLIPRDIFKKIILNQDSMPKIFELSDKANTHPAIAAGMIRHKTGYWGKYSELVNFMDVRKEFGLDD